MVLYFPLRRCKWVVAVVLLILWLRQSVQVYGPHGETVILRIRNPWGNDTEWNGAWSDNAQEWYYISEEQKSDMKVVFAQDGEFWLVFPYVFLEISKANCWLDIESCEHAAGEFAFFALFLHFRAKLASWWHFALVCFCLRLPACSVV